MRLFVAVIPPARVCEDLSTFLAPRHGVVDGPRWSAAAQWHLTLAFMGTAPAGVVEPLEEALSCLTARVRPGRVSIEGSLALPNPYAARVLAAGVRDTPAGWLAALAHTVRSGCAVAGAAPEGGPFRAHLTLGRFGRPTEATRWLRVVDTYRGEPFAVTQVALVESHLGRGRGQHARHDILATFGLGGPGPVGSAGSAPASPGPPGP